eukprot:4355543-Prorocentrum_lima.AAC.1
MCIRDRMWSNCKNTTGTTPISCYLTSLRPSSRLPPARSPSWDSEDTVSYTHLRAHETRRHL